jgi:hypothetical protein
MCSILHLKDTTIPQSRGEHRNETGKPLDPRGFTKDMTVEDQYLLKTNAAGCVSDSRKELAV